MCKYKVLSPCSKCSASRQVVIPCVDGIMSDKLCTRMPEYKGSTPDGVGELCEIHCEEAHERIDRVKIIRSVSGILASVGSAATCAFIYQGSNLSAVLAGSAVLLQGVNIAVTTMTVANTRHKITGS